jgi:hypothetical protein
LTDNLTAINPSASHDAKQPCADLKRLLPRLSNWNDQYKEGLARHEMVEGVPNVATDHQVSESSSTRFERKTGMAFTGAAIAVFFGAAIWVLH